jgi:Zn ribbon nucleic-acid-binding protein
MSATEQITLIAEFQRRRRAMLRTSGFALALFVLALSLHFLLPDRLHPVPLLLFLTALAMYGAIGFKDMSRCPRCDANFNLDKENWVSPRACKECGQAFRATPPNKSLERTREG